MLQLTSLTFVVNCVGSSNRILHGNKHYIASLNIAIKFFYMCIYIYVLCIVLIFVLFH